VTPERKRDAADELLEAEGLLLSARGFRGRALVDRSVMHARLAAARTLLDAELREARDVLRDRDAILEEGRAEVARLKAEHQRSAALGAEGGSIAAEARKLVDEAADFSERTLADLEVVLQRLLSAIVRAREELHEHGGVTPSESLRRLLAGE
jgi:hypothetical protein